MVGDGPKLADRLRMAVSLESSGATHSLTDQDLLECADALDFKERSIFRAMPGYPWLDPCPRCGFRGSCDCTVLERARAAHPGLIVPEPNRQ